MPVGDCSSAFIWSSTPKKELSFSVTRTVNHCEPLPWTICVSAPGSPLTLPRSVAAGQVVYADWLRGFGNLIILDHGAGYMSLYGNNETLYKQVGDSIHGGDTIATVGNSGGNADSGLYFEMRHQGKPLDPLTWVTVK